MKSRLGKVFSEVSYERVSYPLPTPEQSVLERRCTLNRGGLPAVKNRIRKPDPNHTRVETDRVASPGREETTGPADQVRARGAASRFLAYALSFRSSRDFLQRQRIKTFPCGLWVFLFEAGNVQRKPWNLLPPMLRFGLLVFLRLFRKRDFDRFDLPTLNDIDVRFMRRFVGMNKFDQLFWRKQFLPVVGDENFMGL